MVFTEMPPAPKCIHFALPWRSNFVSCRCTIIWVRHFHPYFDSSCTQVWSLLASIFWAHLHSYLDATCVQDGCHPGSQYVPIGRRAGGRIRSQWQTNNTPPRGSLSKSRATADFQNVTPCPAHPGRLKTQRRRARKLNTFRTLEKNW